MKAPRPNADDHRVTASAVLASGSMRSGWGVAAWGLEPGIHGEISMGGGNLDTSSRIKFLIQAFSFD